jgi:hypothetical protein
MRLPSGRDNALPIRCVQGSNPKKERTISVRSFQFASDQAAGGARFAAG